MNTLQPLPQTIIFWQKHTFMPADNQSGILKT